MEKRAIEIEGFCGLVLIKHFRVDFCILFGFRDYWRELITDTTPWISRNHDPEGINCPEPVLLKSMEKKAD